MKKIFVILGLLILVGCGKKTETVTGVAGTNGKSCHVEEINTGAAISCDDGSYVQVNNGEDGAECNVQTVGNASFLNCGDSVVQITTNNETTSTDGCTVSENNNVVTIDCGDSEVSFEIPSTDDSSDDSDNDSKPNCSKGKKKGNKFCKED